MSEQTTEQTLSKTELLKFASRRNIIYGATNVLLVFPLLLLSVASYTAYGQQQALSWAIFWQVLSQPLALVFLALLVGNLLLDIVLSRQVQWLWLRKLLFVPNLAFIVLLIVQGNYVLIPFLLYKLFSYFRYISFFQSKDIRL